MARTSFIDFHPSHARRARRVLASAAAVGAGALALAPQPAAAAGCVATPQAASLADSTVDGEYSVAPEATSLRASFDAACNLTLSYDVINQGSLLSRDFVGWFLNVDGNLLTGSPTGFRGADYAVGRDAAGSELAAINNAGQLTSLGVIASSGEFGAAFDLTRVVGLGARTLTVAGATSWRSSGGTSYYDWVPEPGLAPLPFPVNLAAPAPAPTPAPVPTPAPTPLPAPSTPLPGAGADEDADCEVPPAKGIKLSTAKARLRAAGCGIGAVRRERSRTIKAGRVIRLSKWTGELVPAGTPVRIIVSKGPGPKARRSALPAAGGIASQLEALRTAVR